MVDAFGDDEGALPRGLGEEQEELVSTETAEVVVGAETLGDGSATPRRAASPAAWPWMSLMALKWSTSMRAMESFCWAAVDALEFDGELVLDAAAVEGAGEGVLKDCFWIWLRRPP